MRERTELHQILTNIMGQDPVYYQPPSKIQYPCIIYHIDDYDIKNADNSKYLKMRRYQIVFIRTSTKKDDRIEQILDLPYCSFDRQYISDNLVHDSFTLYF